MTPGREIVAIHPAQRLERYGLEVHHQIRAGVREDYARMGRSVSACADIAAAQFDPTIWAGEDGEAVVDFAGALSIPAVATMHGIPPDPSAHERQVIVALAESVGSIVALSSSASDLLVERYRLDPRQIKVIPHGVPDLPAASEGPSHPALELEGRKVLLSFGLLSPAKRLERVLAALPAIVARHPETLYLILGATHPDELAAEGEAYRDRLARLAKQLGVARSVRFVNEFPGRFELTRWIQAADVAVIPEAETRRTDSATLAYAMAAGRAIVTSRNAYAVEMLGGGAGVLATTAPAGLAAAINRLLSAPDARRAMGARAHERTAGMSWTRVGLLYRDLFARVAGTLPNLTGDTSVLAATA